MRTRPLAAAVVLAIAGAGCAAPPAPASTAPGAASMAPAPGVELRTPDLDQLRFEHSVAAVADWCAEGADNTTAALDAFEQAALTFLAAAPELTEDELELANMELMALQAAATDALQASTEQIDAEVWNVWVDPRIEPRVQMHHREPVGASFGARRALDGLSDLMGRYYTAVWFEPEMLDELPAETTAAIATMRDAVSGWATSCAENLTLERSRPAS